MKKLTKPCPTGCGRRCAIGMLACRDCWRAVPRDLQREVSRTWSAVTRAGGLLGASPEQLEAYRAARDAALASVQ